MLALVWELEFVIKYKKKKKNERKKKHAKQNRIKLSFFPLL